MGIFTTLFGNGGATYSGLSKLTYRHPFSEFFPYVSYNEKDGYFVNIDESIGFLWECTPLCFAGSDTYKTLSGLLKASLPQDSIVQFILYSDSDVSNIVSNNRKKKTKESPLLNKALNRFRDFIDNGTDGLSKNAGIPVRNFRVFAAVKIPSSRLNEIKLDDVKNSFEEILHGIGTFPRIMNAEDLIDLLRKILNDNPSEVNNRYYDDTIPINRQILMADSTVDFISPEELKIGGKYLRCLTPKLLPQKIDALTMNEVFGGIWGLESDFDQITAQFLCSISVVFNDIKKGIESKINTTLAQKSAGSFIYKLERRKDEFKEMSYTLDETKYVSVMPVIWVWTDNREKTMKEAYRIRRIWDSKGFLMQNDSYIIQVLFISSLPFGLYNMKRNLDFIDRCFIMPDDSSSYMIPIQGDFMGYGSSLLFFGRKGQLVGLDIFSSKAPNYNIFVAAGSGNGKSFLVNYLQFNSYVENGIIRIIDLGGSYKKMVHLCNARYMDFSDDSICLNPFSGLVNTEPDEIKYSLNSIAAVVLQMCFFNATSSAAINENNFTLAKEAVKYAYAKAGSEADIDLVWEFLANFKNFAPELEICQDSKCAEDLEKISGLMSFNLREFTPRGNFGKLFNGKSTFNIKDDQFVVLELEYLKRVKELFNVVTLIMLDETTRELYLSDRSTPRFIIVDEAYQFLGNSTIQKEVIEEGYRRARKYKGSFGVVTQSVLDLKRFGDVGTVINANSAYKFYLESDDFEKAKAENLLDYTSFEMSQLKSLNSKLPDYSEIFIDSPYGKGVVRLIVDPYNYYIYTSNPNDINKIETLVKSGLTYDQAIESLL